MKIVQLSSTKLSDQAYETIKNFILKNELLPGQAISINSLAKNLGISPTPVREAVLKLSADGLLIGEPHKQMHVTEIMEDDVSQIYEVRRLLEPQAAKLAAEKISSNPDLRDFLEKVQKQAIEIIEVPSDQINYDDYLDIDFKLNDIFLQSVRQFFRTVLEFLGDRSLRIRTFAEATNNKFSKDTINSVTKEHLGIIQAILEEYPEEAKSRVLQHLDKGEERTLRAIQKMLNH